MLRTDLNSERISVADQADVYWIDQGRRRRIPSIDLYQRLFANAPTTTMALADVEAIDEGEPLSLLAQVARTQGTNDVYMLEPDYQVKRAVRDERTITQYGFATANFRDVAPGILDAIAEGPLIVWPEPTLLRTDLDGLRVQVQGDTAVYLIDQGAKRLIPTNDLYAKLYGSDPSNASSPTPISQSDLDAIKESAPLSGLTQLVKTQGDAAVYLLEPDFGMKRLIYDAATLARYSFAAANVVEVPVGILDTIATGPTIMWPETAS